MRNLRKVAFIFIISTIILSVFNLSNATTGVVNTPAVRIREKASTDSEVLTKGYEGEEVEILGEEGDWYKVKINGKTGYASKSLIKEKDAEEKPKNETSFKNTTSTENTTVVENTSTDTNKVSTYETEKEENTVKNETAENNSAIETTSSVDANKKNIVKEDISLKLLPSFSSNNIKLLTKGEEVKVNKELNNWAEITIEGTTGWVLKNKIGESAEETPVDSQPQPEPDAENEPEETNAPEENKKQDENKNEAQTSVARNSKGIINVETANVRAKADKKSSIIAHLDEGDEVTIVEEIGDWYKITNSEVSSGYVAKQLITLSDVTSRSTSESRKENVQETVTTSNATTAKGSEVVQFAKQYLGTSYVLGGKTPESGFDCSGYTRYVFKNFGYSLGTVAASQDTVGTEVSREQLKEGDLILFYNEGKTKIGHTGIYIGGDQFIHAANPERGVVIDGFSTNSYYSSRFVTARRIVE